MEINDLCNEECFSINYNIPNEEMNKAFEKEEKRYCSDASFTLNIEPNGDIRGAACRNKLTIGNILEPEITIKRESRECNYTGKNECFACWNLLVSNNKSLCDKFINTLYNEPEIKIDLEYCKDETTKFKQSVLDGKMYTEFTDGKEIIQEADWTTNNCSINMNYCSYGITGIYIGPDGEVLRAPCHAKNNFICNIDETEKLEIPKEICICNEPNEKCIMCGSALFSKNKDILIQRIKEWEEVVARK